jgi:hypothetical protein
MKMDIQKKIKVVDSVFFSDEIDYLLFRFTELDESVDVFVILESSDDSNIISEFEKNIHKFEKWKEKIIHIKSTIPSQEEIDEIFYHHDIKNLNLINTPSDYILIKLLYDFKIKLNSLQLNFEDIIMISNIDEFPVVPSIDILQNYLSFEPIVFSQKDFVWTKDFCSSKNHQGTLCFSFSHLVTNNLLFTLNLSKKHDSKLELSEINFGYRFAYFSSIEETLKIISRKYNQLELNEIQSLIVDSRNNLLYFNIQSQSNLVPLKKYFGELPKNIDMLNNQTIGRDYPKKHFVVINDDELYCNEDIFDSISIIKSSNNISSKNLTKDSDKIITHFIVLPKEKYYDILIKENNLENFQEMYFFNEIKKILVLQFPLDIDIFVFNYNGISLTYSWSEIKNNFIYDLLNK